MTIVSHKQCGHPLPSDLRKYKRPLSDFLRRNPFSHPLTEGFFYREKMRAIHHVAPDEPFREILEVGGGQGGLTALLYPHAKVTNLDLDPKFGHAPCNNQSHVRFTCGNAATLPFKANSFDAVTLFDVLEHVPEDDVAVSEALRVLRPGGVLLVSCPNENWRFPYYEFMISFCPSESDMWNQWGHVRRGYDLVTLERLTHICCEGYATFITPITVLCHDVAFSRFPPLLRRLLCLALSPVTWFGYTAHRPHSIGTETASAWRKPHSI